MQTSGTPYHYFTGCLFSDVNNIAAAWLAQLHPANCYYAGTTEAPLEGTLVWDPGNLADGAGETSSGITVTGAAVGDRVEVFAPYDLQDVTVQGNVAGANTCEIHIENTAGGARDLASGTWRVRVVKP